MGIFFTDKVEHRHGSKKVSRKTAKIEMKIKQEELKQLREQGRMQRRQQFVQQYCQPVEPVAVPVVEQPVPVQQPVFTEPAISQETKEQVNATTLNEIQQQQAKLTGLITYQQQLKANTPKMTKLECFITIATYTIFFMTLPTIIGPCLAIVVGGCWINTLDTEHTRHNKEIKSVTNEIKTTKEIICQLKANLL
jgi:hypothetical protein